jgi:pyridoxine 5-phosphate synthase
VIQLESFQMTRLSVNVNKIALLRNSRSLGIPCVLRATQIALDAGAHGITVHPRPDGRHIRPDDVRELSLLLATRTGVEFNIEGNPFEPPLLEMARQFRPAQCTLVPDDPAALTSDHGWNVQRDALRLVPVVEELHRLGIRVSLFMDPDPAAMAAAAETGADRIELYTEPYASSHAEGNCVEMLQIYTEAARSAQAVGLAVNAGHDLNRKNLQPFLAAVPDVVEVSIGHALVAEALEFGLDSTVRQYLRAMVVNR